MRSLFHFSAVCILFLAIYPVYSGAHSNDGPHTDSLLVSLFPDDWRRELQIYFDDASSAYMVCEHGSILTTVRGEFGCWGVPERNKIGSAPLVSLERGIYDFCGRSAVLRPPCLRPGDLFWPQIIEQAPQQGSMLLLRWDWVPVGSPQELQYLMSHSPNVFIQEDRRVYSQFFTLMRLTSGFSLLETIILVMFLGYVALSLLGVFSLISPDRSGVFLLVISGLSISFTYLLSCFVRISTLDFSALHVFSLVFFSLLILSLFTFLLGVLFVLPRRKASDSSA